MGHFVSTHTNKIDGKGRVSVPAQFRTALGEKITDGIYLVPALEPALDCIEVWPDERMQKFVEAMDTKLEEMSSDQEELADLVLLDSEKVKIEDNGRIHVPPRLVAEGGFTDTVVFTGRGDHFQMWEPQRFAAYKSRLDAVKKPGANRTVRRIISSGRMAQ